MFLNQTIQTNSTLELTLSLDIAVGLQSAIVGLFMIFYKGGLGKSRKFIGLFLLAFAFNTSLEVIPQIEMILQTDVFGGRSRFLPFNFLFFQITMLFCYIYSISKQKIESPVLLFAPGILEFLIYTYFFISPPLSADGYTPTDWFLTFEKYYTIASFGYSFYFSFRIIRQINRFNKSLSEMLSDLQNKSLSWVKLICYGLLLTEIIFIVHYYIITPPDIETMPDAEYALWEPLLNNIHIFLACINLAFIYFISIGSLVQFNLENELPRELSTQEEDEEDLVDEELARTFDEIEVYVKANKPYLNSNLTLGELSKQIELDTKLVSRAINEIGQRSFYGYINSYRVDTSKEMLLNKDFEHYSILGIGFESGFNSKASFYKNFKEVTGTTPSLFLEQHK